MIPSTSTTPLPSTTGPRMPYELLADKSSTGNKLAEDTNTTGSEPMREAFSDFVGQTLFGSMLATMREGVGKAAYFDGGRAEEVFQQQLDQKLVEEISDASASSFVDPMFDLFQLQRRG
ncbi:rod-binding protein [Aporhodopirellula aestuarii]|uniref:Rod-binding protein n=1 Tax=Aporhodopirellula aestuarii TaxID=2950107 RepID=A0ABT0U0T0_9BACT|nr:rod-binding protein [Aporhodopirellula aestuarii]MCM2370455.1 rod-binding protein [Aporhodopirellula aestuarii]